MPKIEFNKKKFKTIDGNIPDPFLNIKGCEFFERCSNRINGKCNKNNIDINYIDNEHYVRCINY